METGLADPVREAGGAQVPPPRQLRSLGLRSDPSLCRASHRQLTSPPPYPLPPINTKKSTGATKRFEIKAHHCSARRTCCFCLASHLKLPVTEMRKRQPFPLLLAEGVGVTCEVSCYDESGHLGVLERVCRSSPPTSSLLLSASFSNLILPFGIRQAKNSGRLSFIQVPFRVSVLCS